MSYQSYKVYQKIKIVKDINIIFANNLKNKKFINV